MILRWVLAALGGAWLSAVGGSLACLLTPGEELNGIAVGAMVSVLVWVLLTLGLMSTQRLLRFSVGSASLGLLGSLLLVWSVLS